MESIVVNRRNTFFHSDFLEDYYNTDKFDNLRTYRPNIEEISRAIENKKNFSFQKRETLVTVLKEQYEDASIDVTGVLKENIELLKQSNTYTITTGQQIHLGLGPLYVMYKAFDTIAIAKELAEKYPDNHFVPVFWMATEDHDLEEIAEIDAFGTKKKWETNQKGAVGRMKPEGVSTIFEQISQEFNFSKEQYEFLSVCQRVYTESENLSIAFRKLIHTYIGDKGILLLDADDRRLKESFSEVLSDELQHKNVEALQKTTKEFEGTGYEKQLHIRECNLFDMSGGDRIKIEQRFESSSAETQVQQDVYNLSPNASLRPFYQEWVLPNLVYVGGPSELKYWLQLKGIFDNYSMPMPLLHLRTSHILLPSKVADIIDNLDVEMLFGDEDKIATYYSSELQILEQDFEKIHQDVVQSLLRYSTLASSAFPGFSLEGKLKKVLPKVEELPLLIKEQIVKKSLQNSDLNKVLKTKSKYFSKKAIQERSEHVVGHVQLLGFDLKQIYSHFGLKKSQKIGLLFI